MAQLAQLAVTERSRGQGGALTTGASPLCRSRRTVCTSRPPERTAGCGYGTCRTAGTWRWTSGTSRTTRGRRRSWGYRATVRGCIVPRATATCSCLTRSAPVGRRAIEAMAMTKMITRRKRYGGRSEPAAVTGAGPGTGAVEVGSFERDATTTRTTTRRGKNG